MAKKIVSLLCALAMLVTMVSLVATFTASATGTSSVYFPQLFRSGNYDIEASACSFKAYAAGTENRKDQTMIHGDASLGNFAALRTYGLSYKATDKNVFNLSGGFTLEFVVMTGNENNTKSAVVSIGKLAVAVNSPGTDDTNTVTSVSYDGTQLDTRTVSMTGAANTQYIDAFQAYNGTDYLSSVSGTLRIRRCVVTYDGAGNVTVNVYKRNDTPSAPKPISTLDFTLSGTIASPDFGSVRVAVEVGIGSATTGTSVACGAFQGTFTPAAVDAYDAGATYVTTNMGNFANNTYGFARTNTSVANSAVQGTRTYFNVAQRVAAYDASDYGLGTALYVVGDGSSSLNTKSVRAVDNTVYNLSGGFEASWSYFATYPACDIKHVVSFGQLAVVIEKTSSLSASQANVWVEYAGTPVTAVQTLTFPNPNSATTTAANNMLSAMYTAGLTGGSATDTNSYTMSNNRWGNFAISYDGVTKVVTLNVTNSDGAALGTTFSATLASPKLNAGVVSMEIVDAYSNYRRSALLNFRGTYERKLSSASIDVYGNGGTPSVTALDLTSDGHIDASALPTATIDDIHKKFGGWYTAADDSGEPVDLATSTFNPGDAIYAHWDNIPYVNVNGNGGKANVTYVDLDDAGHLTSMPTATRRHNTLTGWFDDAENGNEITTASVLADGDTIYAHWALSPNEMVDFSAANTTTGYFVDTENYPVSIFSKNGTAAFHTLGTLGSYSMDNFTIDMNYYYNHQRTNTDGAVGPYMILTVGDLVLTFEMTRGSTSDNNWASVLYDLSGTYKNQALTFSNTQINSGLRTYESTMANSYNEIHAVNSNFSAWGNYQSISYGFHFRFSYDRATGVLTIQNIKNNAANWTSTATVGTDGFENAAVSVELISPSVPKADGTGLDTNQHKVTLANVYGVYTPFTPAATYLTPVGAGLTLDSSEDKNTAISFVYDKAEVDAEFAGLADPYCMAVLDGQNYELPLTTATFNSTEYYVATLEKVTPNLFGTKVTCMLTNADYDVIGDAFEYSVKDYCTNMMTGTVATAELKAVCANLLVYGEAARAYVGSPADSITDGVDVSAAVTAHADGAAIGASGTGIAFTSAMVNMRENVSLVVNVADSAALANYQLVCQPASGDTYRLTYTAATVSGGVAQYVIPVGIVNAYTEYNVYLYDVSADEVVSKEYQLSIAGLCTYIEEDANDSYSAADEALAASILNLATAVAAL